MTNVAIGQAALYSLTTGSDNVAIGSVAMRLATTEPFVGFMLEVFRLGAAMGGFVGPGDLLWRCDEEYTPLTVWVDCSDVFWWGTADNEPLTPDTVKEMWRAIADVESVYPQGMGAGATALYCCRQREMRPQGPYWKYIDKSLWPLFEACGPERADSPRSE